MKPLLEGSLIYNINKNARALNPAGRAANVELDWFRFEQKIRNIIDNLMVPLVTQVSIMKENNDDMKKTVTSTD
jgi:hypothetical protein